MFENFNISPLLKEEEIKSRVAELGAELTEKFKDKKAIAICVLKGSIMFYSDLIREIKTDLVCEFLAVSSYGNSTKSTGEVKLTLDLNNPIEGRDVIIIEDIVDTGLTLNYLVNNLKFELISG